MPKREDPEWSRFVGPDHMLDKLSDIMGQLAVFDTLTWRELATLERIVHRRRFMAGEVVI
ncbi:MAG: hypothetical protein HN521_21850, partial [Candidatus Latescibacteria bacterium]|nr:hypothetical protein [Candidatus Latescibacterota bacterium]